jgi:ATP-dependent helicase YprA (DUF1998 family)
MTMGVLAVEDPVGTRLFIDKEHSRTIADLTTPVADNDELLLSLFDVGFVRDLLATGLATSDSTFSYRDDQDRDRSGVYRQFLNQDIRVEEERIREFVPGTMNVHSISYKRPADMVLPLLPGTEDQPAIERFDRANARILPEAVARAVAQLIRGDETAAVTLRLFQEDSLFFSLARLLKPDTVRERALLISVPTGGGKTESFVISMVSYLVHRKYEQKVVRQELPPGVRALVIYPTKALANDQAKRMAELMREINNQLRGVQVTLGIFTGDTPGGQGDLVDGRGVQRSLFQVCPNCEHGDFEFVPAPGGTGPVVQVCKHCGHRMDYLRVTRQDILKYPPDVLITNPDTINYHMQIPERQVLLTSNVELVAFDEVHEYSGIFGCNVAHLLRRFEALRDGPPPFYIGLSATIGNAQTLASMLFNVDTEEILYLKHRTERPYLEEGSAARKRLHLLVTPNMSEAYPMTATINVASSLGHAIRDPHFRKILIFTNFKSDHDKLSYQIPEQESQYVALYQELRKQPNRPLNTSDRRIVAQVGGWYEWATKHLTLHAPELGVGWHRGALEMEKRLRAVNQFAALNRIITGDRAAGHEDPLDVMVATKTLELGIDIGNVSFVINSSAPFSNNEYVQRVGRGGRRRDSAAITVLNPDNAIDAYMREHFQEFVFPTVFEDAPIIVSNRLILETHLKARICDYLARKVRTGFRVTVGDWLNDQITCGGSTCSLTSNPAVYAEALLDVLLPGDRLQEFLDWFGREAKELGTGTTDVDRTFLVGILRAFCTRVADRTRPGAANPLTRDQLLTGADEPALPEMRPSLRASGPGVGLWLAKSQQGDEYKESISRDRAIYSNPPGSYQSQGRNLFVIDEIKEEDPDTDTAVRDILADFPPALDHFRRQFPDSSLREPRPWHWRIRTVKELRVRHFPGRFSCKNPNCLRTYTAGELTDDLKCPACHWDLEQVTQVYECPQCRTVVAPPVPKVCYNPACLRSKWDKDQAGRINPNFNLAIALKRAIKRRDPSVLNGFFRFIRRPALQWECADCHTLLSFHDRNVAKKAGVQLGKKPEGNFDTPNGPEVAAWYALYRPELPGLGTQEYTNRSLHLNGFNCPDQQHCGFQAGLRPVNHRRVQTDVVQYHVARERIAPERETAFGRIGFYSGDAVSMARRWSAPPGRDQEGEDTLVPRHSIFGDGALYATKFSPHMFSLHLGGNTDRFLQEDPCQGRDCANCDLIEKLELHELYRPSLQLEQGEVENGKPARPDPRAAWCPVARDNRCTTLSCSECPETGGIPQLELKRHVLLHTLKHAIIWALPKYTGLDAGAFKGFVRPGVSIDGQPAEPDLLVLDVHDGGSGAVYLIDRWWDNYIAPMAQEIVALAAENRANLNLPYTCSHFNHNLCPIIAGRFVAWMKQQGE